MDSPPVIPELPASLPGDLSLEPDIDTLLRRVPSDSPARRIATGVLLDEPLVDVAPLVAIAVNPSAARWKERALAALTLARAPLTAEQRNQAAQALIRVVTRQNGTDVGCAFRALLYYGVSVTALTTGFLALFAGIGSPETGTLMAVALLLSLFLGLPAIPISLGIDDRRANRVRAAALAALGRLGGPEDALWPVSGAIQDASRLVRRAVPGALRALLPRVGPQHWGVLPALVVPNLCRVLEDRAIISGTAAAESLAHEVLRALEHMGDARAILAVRMTAQRHPAPEVRQHASQVQIVLEERQRRDNAASMLLRGSQAPSAAPGELLRAAEAAPHTPPEQLLRATLGEGDKRS